jgi:hypothetical protein
MDNGGLLASPGVSQTHSFHIVELRLFFTTLGKLSSPALRIHPCEIFFA